MKFNDDAVSPVIGVILMVAITVILAAVIAAFVFGMANTIQTTKIVAATTQQPDATHIIVTYQGGRDAGSCENVTISVTPGDGATKQIFTLEGTGTPPVLTVGESHTFTSASGSSFAGKDHVTATAHFSDGTDQVIMDNTI